MNKEKVLILNASWTSGYRVRVDHMCHSRKAAENYVNKFGSRFYFAVIPSGGVTNEEVGDWIQINNCDETFGSSVMLTGAAIQQMSQLDPCNGWALWLND